MILNDHDYETSFIRLVRKLSSKNQPGDGSLAKYEDKGQGRRMARRSMTRTKGVAKTNTIGMKSFRKKSNAIFSSIFRSYINLTVLQQFLHFKQQYVPYMWLFKRKLIDKYFYHHGM